MKISELISFLDKTKSKYGNLDMVRDIADLYVTLDKESMYVDDDKLALHIE